MTSGNTLSFSDDPNTSYSTLVLQALAKGTRRVRVEV